MAEHDSLCRVFLTGLRDRLQMLPQQALYILNLFLPSTPADTLAVRTQDICSSREGV